jgi:hypothetical protein
MMVLLGVLMIVVIMSSVVLSAYAHVLTSFPVLGEWIGPAISGFTHYGILTIFFTLLYKWLPTGGVPWRFALVSGAVNSLLFAVGNRALVYYFEVTNLTSAFGATAGFAAIMVWMYWTSLTILVGAQVGRAARDAFVDGEPRPEAARRTPAAGTSQILRFAHNDDCRERQSSEHRRQHAVGRLVAVGEGLDVDQHLLAHLDAAFERRPSPCAAAARRCRARAASGLTCGSCS